MLTICRGIKVLANGASESIRKLLYTISTYHTVYTEDIHMCGWEVERNLTVNG